MPIQRHGMLLSGLCRPDRIAPALRVLVFCLAVSPTVAWCDEAGPAAPEKAGSARQTAATADTVQRLGIVDPDAIRSAGVAGYETLSADADSGDENGLRWNDRQPVFCWLQPHIVIVFEDPRTVSVFANVFGSGGYKVAQTERVRMHASREITPEERSRIEGWSLRVGLTLRWPYAVQSGAYRGSSAMGLDVRDGTESEAVPVGSRWRSYDGGWVIDEYETQFEADRRVIGAATSRVNDYLEGMIEELCRMGFETVAEPGDEDAVEAVPALPPRPASDGDDSDDDEAVVRSDDTSVDEGIAIYVRPEWPGLGMLNWKVTDSGTEREIVHPRWIQDLAGERLLVGVRVDEQLRPAREGPMFAVHYDVSRTREGVMLRPLAQHPMEDVDMPGGHVIEYAFERHADKLRGSILDSLAQTRETAAEHQETRGTYLLLKLEEAVIWDGREYGEIPPLLANEEFLNVNAKAVSRLRWHLEARPSEALLPFVVWNLCYQADVDSAPRIMEFLDKAEASPTGVRTEAIRGLAYLGHDHPEALETHMNAGTDLRLREIRAMLETIRETHALRQDR